MVDSTALGFQMSLWRKIQRTNKKAAKYRFNVTLNDLLIDGNDGWQPEQIVIALMHRRRRYETKPRRVEPSFADKCRCLVVWPEQAPDFIEVMTTLYKDQRNQQFDDKEWTLIVEEVTPKRKNRPLAAVALNLRMFINETPGEKTELKMKLRPLREEVRMCLIKFVIGSQFLKEGDAIDDDMQSIASGVSESVSIDDLVKASSSENVEPLTPADKEAAVGIAKVSDEIKQRFALEPECPRLPVKARDEFFKPPSPPKLIRPPWREAAEKKRDSVESPQSPAALVFPEVPVHRIEPKPEVEPSVTLREKTPKLQHSIPELIPNEDLLDWCKRIAKEYKFLNITDFTCRAFKSGYAFCALIHRYHPELIGDIHQVRQNGNHKDNCTKAFQVAEEHLGVKSTLDINDVVMCPEKNKVKAYVERLRHALEGTTPTDVVDAARMSDYRLSQHPFYGFSESDEKVMEELQKLKEKNMEVDAVDYSNVPETTDGGDVKYAAVVPGISAPEEKKPAVMSTPLMSRKQLADPFASDEEEAPKVNGFGSPSQSTNTPLNVKLERLGGSANQAELRQRARQMLANPDPVIGASSLTPGQDDDRNRRLLEEARQRIEEARTDGGTFTVSGQQPGFHRTASSRSSLRGSSTDLRNLGMVEREVAFYKFNKRQPSPVLQRKNYDTPSIPAFGRPSQRTVTSNLTANGGPSALDRVKRYGSMRRQELSETIQQFVAGSMIPPGSNDYASDDVNSTPTRKLTNDWERDAQDPARIEQELSNITLQMVQLEKEHMSINEKIQDVVQGSNEEQKLIEAAIKCTSDRDKLQKKVDYYNDVLTIIELTESIEKKRRELDGFRDEFKTEEEKKHIDKLMNELRDLTNEKMIITMKVGNVRSEEQEHDEHLRRTLDRTQNLGAFQRGATQSASKRVIDWLRS
ncbi:hypothetical protein QR680_006634 [Steinernema hermaphroditum]|uniref:Calponin-homology (CH) domain-containing protein n=1 Tax=Steinernema hermaphroditum TaxID=289476 RepID=A0AA39LXF9_9BILA|nr:hypothetical protein QR680_006634 [Steinernema hermaphroditum]